jgi:hypothetical protein
MVFFTAAGKPKPIFCAYFLRKINGDTIALTSTAGTIAAAYSYNPWGAVSGTGDIPNPFQYVGRYGVIHDRETGLDQMGLRYYNLILRV